MLQKFSLKNITAPLQRYTHTSKTRIMDDKSIVNFQSHLRKEAWDSVYNSEDVNEMFNNFHCTFLRHFENSFPLRYKSGVIKLFKAATPFTIPSFPNDPLEDTFIPHQPLLISTIKTQMQLL